jgi:hypothetical protein
MQNFATSPLAPMGQSLRGLYQVSSARGGEHQNQALRCRHVVGNAENL